MSILRFLCLLSVLAIAAVATQSCGNNRVDNSSESAQTIIEEISVTGKSTTTSLMTMPATTVHSSTICENYVMDEFPVIRDETGSPVTLHPLATDEDKLYFAKMYELFLLMDETSELTVDEVSDLMMSIYTGGLSHSPCNPDGFQNTKIIFYVPFKSSFTGSGSAGYGLRKQECEERKTDILAFFTKQSSYSELEIYQIEPVLFGNEYGVRSCVVSITINNVGYQMLVCERNGWLAASPLMLPTVAEQPTLNKVFDTCVNDLIPSPASVRVL